MKRQTILLCALLMVMGACERASAPQTTAPCGETSHSTSPTPTPVEAEAGLITTTYSAVLQESSGACLSFSSAGLIERLDAREGQMVRAGQVLAVVNSEVAQNALLSAEALVAGAEQTLRHAEDAYNRMSALHASATITEQQWIEVETRLAQARAALQSAQAQERIARKTLHDTRLTAPFTGYIARVYAELGETALPSTAIVKLVQHGRQPVTKTDHDTRINAISLGDEWAVTLSPTSTYRARVIEKGVSADPLTLSYKVTATIDNPRHELLPGMLCEIDL